MSTHRIRYLAVLTLAAGTLPGAYAADQDSPWGLAIFGGNDLHESGSLRAPATTTIPDIGALDPSFAGTSGALTLDKLRYDDMFHRRYDAGAELSYTFNNNVETFGRFSYDALSGRTRSIGMFSDAALGVSQPLNAHFVDEDNWTLELGSRVYVPTSTSLRPFAAAALGATHLDPIRASLNIPGTAVNLHDVDFTRRATVFSQSVETGLDFAPSDNFDVRFAVGADHLGTPPSSRDRRLNDLGINSARDAESRWTFPVSLAAVYHFETPG